MVFVKTIGNVVGASSPAGMAAFFPLWASATVDNSNRLTRIVRLNVRLLRRHPRKLLSLSGPLPFLTFPDVFLTFVYPYLPMNSGCEIMRHGVDPFKDFDHRGR